MGRSLENLRQQVWRSRAASLWGCLALVLALGGCGGGGGSGTAASTALPDAQATIDAAGGSVVGPDQVSVTVPAGAASAPVTVRIAKDSTGAPALPAGVVQQGAIYQITPHGNTFSKPVTVRIPFDSSQLQSGETAAVLQASPGKNWTVHLTPRLGNGYLEVDVTHFSYFAGVRVATTVTKPDVKLELVSSRGSLGNFDMVDGLNHAYGTISKVEPISAAVAVALPEAMCPVGSLIYVSLYFMDDAGNVQPQFEYVTATLDTTHHATATATLSANQVMQIKTLKYINGFEVDCGTSNANGDNLNYWFAPTAKSVSMPTSFSDPGMVVTVTPRAEGYLEVGATLSQIGDGSLCTTPTAAKLEFLWGGTLAGQFDLTPKIANGVATFTSQLLRDSLVTDNGAVSPVALVTATCGAGNTLTGQANIPHQTVGSGKFSDATLVTIQSSPQSAVAALGATARFTVNASPALIANASKLALVPNLSDSMRVEWLQSTDSGSTWTKVAEGTIAAPQTGSITTLALQPSAYFDLPVTDAAQNGALIRARVCAHIIGSSEQCVISHSATLTVPTGAAAPSITQTPASVLVTTGQTASFTAVAAGTPAATLQWQKRAAASSTWADVAGATSGTLTTPVATLADNGTQWRLVATNAIGSTASAPATLSVSDVGVAPTIGVQPGSLSVGTGEAAVFAASASGTAPLSYQWRRNGQPVSGANSPVLSLSTVSATDSASRFDLVVSNSYGSVTTRAAVLTVTDQTAVVQAPSIAFISGDLSVAAGNTAMMAVSVSGTGPFTFTWWKEVDIDGYTGIAGATQPVLTLPSVGVNDDTNYIVQVTGPGGFVSSSPIRLRVGAAQGSPPSVTMPQQNVVAGVGGSANFVVTADGTGPFTYHWQKDGVDLPGKTSAVLQIGTVAADSAGTYSVSIDNAYGSTSYTAGTLTVIGVPVVAVQPGDTSVQAGSGASFTVVPQSTDGVYAIWLKNGEPMTGQTGFTLNLPAVALADTGTAYRVVLFNSSGIVFSSSATLTVTAPAQLLVYTYAGGAGSQTNTVTDGKGSSAGLRWPHALAWASDETLYFVDGSYIRKVTPDGTVTTLAGCGFNEYADGTGSGACFSAPESLAVDATGNIWVADTGNCTIRMVTPQGVVTSPFAGYFTTCAHTGNVSASTYGQIIGIAVRADGSVVFANSTQVFELRKVVAATTYYVDVLLGGVRDVPGYVDASSFTARFNQISSIALVPGASDGDVLVADTGNKVIRVVLANGDVSTYAGGAAFASDGQGTLAGFDYPTGVAVDAAGTAYVCDSSTVRKIPRDTRMVTRIAGQFGLGGTDDGYALTAALFNNPMDIAVGPRGLIAVTDPWNWRIRLIF